MVRPELATMKDFAELARLRDELKRKAEADRIEHERQQQAHARMEREARVFQEALGGTVPLKPTGRAPTRPPAAAPHPRQRELDEQAALAASMSDEIDIERLLDTDDQLSYRQVTVGPDVVTRLRRGHWVVQDQIDLHGLRVEEARDALVAFLGRAQRREQRCLRVIHGKGLGSVKKEPVLKNKVLKWLIQRDEVLAFCQAPPNDGGAGALLVLIRAGR